MSVELVSTRSALAAGASPYVGDCKSPCPETGISLALFQGPYFTAAARLVGGLRRPWGSLSVRALGGVVAALCRCPNRGKVGMMTPPNECRMRRLMWTPILAQAFDIQI